MSKLYSYRVFNDTAKPDQKTPDFSKMAINELKDEQTRLQTILDNLESVHNEGKPLTPDQSKEYKSALDRLEAVNAAFANSAEGLFQRRQAAQVVQNLAGASGLVVDLSRGINVTPQFEKDPKSGFESSNEFLKSVVNLYRNGKTEDRRLVHAINAVGDDEYSRGNWESAGVLIPRGFIDRILQTTAEDDFLTPRMTQIPMSAPIVDINARVDKNHSTSVTGGTVVYRTAETRTVSLTKDTFEKITLKASELNGASAVTRQLMQDSPISIPALIEASMKEAAKYKRMDELINGSGNGCPLGFLSSGNTAAIAVNRRSGQADATVLTGYNVLDMRKRVWGYDQAIWLANPDLYDRIATLHIESTNNAGILKFFYPGDLEMNNGKPDMLLGRPIYFTEFMPGIIASNDGSEIAEWNTGFLACVNMSQYLYGVRGTQTVDRSVHVRFLEREEIFLWTMQDDARPWWKTVLTPKNGVSTLSPFVYLTNTDTSG